MIPEVTKGRERAGKSLEGFDIVPAVPSAVTADRGATLDRVRADLVTYLSLPFYRSMLERSGFGEEIAGFDAGIADGDVERAKAAMSEPMLDSLGGFGSADDVQRRRPPLPGRGGHLAGRQPGADRRLRGDPRGGRRADLTGPAVARVVAIADLHGYLPDDLAEGDVLVIAGDVCPISTTRSRSRTAGCASVLPLAGVPPPRRGRLDRRQPRLRLPDARWRPGGRGHYLLDGGADVAGLSFYGTPWVPKLKGWAFYAPDEELAERMASIPAVDVLVPHGPPRGYGDLLARGGRAGSEALLEAIDADPAASSARSATSTRTMGPGSGARPGSRTSPTSTSATRSRPRAERAFDLTPS